VRVAADVQRKVLLLVPQAVAEVDVRELELAVPIAGVGIEQQLVGIEALAPGRVIGAIHAVAVELAGAQLGKVGVEDVGVLPAQLDAIRLPALRGEEAQLDFLGVLGEEGKVDALAVPSRPQRMGTALPDGEAGGTRYGHGAEVFSATPGAAFGPRLPMIVLESGPEEAEQEHQVDGAQFHVLDRVVGFHRFLVSTSSNCVQYRAAGSPVMLPGRNQTRD